MKAGEKFRKSVKKFVEKRVYIWDLIYLKEGEILNDGKQKTIVARFVRNSFTNEYRTFEGDDYKQVKIIDKLEGKVKLIQIYNEFERLGSLQSFFIARKLTKRPEFKIRIGVYLKELIN